MMHGRFLRTNETAPKCHVTNVVCREAVKQVPRIPEATKMEAAVIVLAFPVFKSVKDTKKLHKHQYMGALE